ncbi:response regulator transcription factor [Marivirga sp. S37H4]|uniref:Response regulator transcription factor n=1 Tax=Marivirga aurantiaca TaxID=2802615 RepID=A0A935C6M8_9BACT|nr:response regulator transcription factor [Marivirga aurantiaca]MBK6264459.1 response regulator transcription factor [Marivirga aurantiaca]
MLGKGNTHVLIVDDHLIVRDGIKALLSKSDGIKVVGIAANGDEALKLLRNIHRNVKVVLMDISMPQMDGISATRQIKMEFPHLNVLALSMHDDESHIIDILQEGALGYILKTTSKKELVHAIFRVAEGQSYFGKEASDKLLNYLSGKEDRKEVKATDVLTERETEILGLIAEEYTNLQISEKLFLSPRTIDTHRRNIMQKLNAKNTAGLVKYALTHNIK